MGSGVRAHVRLLDEHDPGIERLDEPLHVASVERAIAVGMPLRLHDIHHLREAVVMQRVDPVVTRAICDGQRGLVRRNAGKLRDRECGKGAR